MSDQSRPSCRVSFDSAADASPPPNSTSVALALSNAIAARFLPVTVLVAICLQSPFHIQVSPNGTPPFQPPNITTPPSAGSNAITCSARAEGGVAEVCAVHEVPSQIHVSFWGPPMAALPP